MVGVVGGGGEAGGSLVVLLPVAAGAGGATAWESVSLVDDWRVAGAIVVGRTTS